MDLAQDTAVARLKAAPGWYTAVVPERWNFRTPSGGVLMTVAMRAMQAELADPELRPVSANTHFCSPVPAGPLEIRVEVLRHGSAAAQMRAQLSSSTVPGPGLEVSATFGRDREARDGSRIEAIDVIDVAPPPVPPPDAVPPMDVVRGTSSGFVPVFFLNFDSRLVLGAPWWNTDWNSGPARVGRWFRYKVSQCLADGRFDPLAIPPIADTMPPALIQKLGPQHPPFHAPSLDLTIHFLEDTTSQWLLTYVHVLRARAGYATANAEIWDEHGRLVATATQMMLLRRVPEGALPPNA